MDEFLDINQEELEKEDCSIILSKGYNMVNLEDDLVFENIKYGIRAKQYDKYYLFNKSKIKEINYEAGCHSANPIGEIKFSKNIYNLYHYTMLSEQYLIDRYKRNFERLSKQNKKNGWGVHYKESEQTIRDKFTIAKQWFRDNKTFNLEQAINIKMIKHNYQDIEGWFNMEQQYLKLLEATSENGIFVELGAYKGKSTSFIVTEIINRDRNIQFYTVDTFQGDSGSNDLKEIQAYKQVNVSSMYEEFVANTNHLCEHLETIIGKSNEAAQLFEDNSVDVIFIDAGHSASAVLADLKAWYPKMRNNSIMSGHDYNSWVGVKTSVLEFFGKEPDKVENDCWFIKIKK
jgi:predicted O-methyltransferase YrrM